MWVVFSLLYFCCEAPHANAFKSKIYKYSQAETCRLAVFCVKLTFCSDFMVPWPRKLSSRSAHLFCEFSSLEECKRFYNILYAYVCKIYEEKFGGCWWSFSWLGQSVSVTVLGQRIHWNTVSVLLDSKVNKKDILLILSFTVLLLQAYEEQCGILLSRFRCKALLANRLDLCKDCWISTV